MADTYRLPPQELERKAIDEHTVQSIYKAGYGTVTVKSIFNGQNSFSDLLYHIVLNKLNPS